MKSREEIIRLWFDMWLKKEDLGIREIFSDKIVYTESWGPRYSDLDTVELWFKEWNSRGKVESREIKQFLDFDDQSMVERYFRAVIDKGRVDEFDGISLVKWDEDNKIRQLKEFVCDRDNYNPYEESIVPVFRKK